MFTNKEARKEAIKREIDRIGEGGEKLRIKWKDGMESFPVISLNLKNVVLNPHSHRIQSQISSHSEEERLRRSPYSEYAQKEFSKMLRNTEEYEDLRDNLREEGQREPGVVTRQGLLVNANRRVTALREIEGQKHVRVAVLPENVSHEEVLDVEASLQVREDFKAEYTYTNQLLLIDNMIEKYGRSKEEVALKLRLATSSADNHLKEGVEEVEKYLSHLSVIKEAQNIIDRGKIPYTFFDDKQIIVSEIVDEYQSKKKTEGYKVAERLKKNRLIGLLSGYKYREIRRIDQDFVEDFFLDSAEEREGIISVDFEKMMEVEDGKEEGQQDLGLGLLGEDAENETAVDAEPLVKTLALAHNEKSVQVPTTEGQEEPVASEKIIEDTRKVLDRATEKARLEEKEEDRLTSPIDRTSEAASKLERARKAYEKACDHPDFENQKMVEKIKEVEGALRRIKNRVGQTEDFEA